MTEDKAWAVFSKYIKLRDTDQYGYGYCIATGSRIHHFMRGGKWHWNCHAGHYISREIKSVMFDESNVHAQSSISNFYGENELFRERIISKIGLENHDRLVSSKNEFGIGGDVLSEEFYTYIIDKYSSITEKLLRNKMF